MTNITQQALNKFIQTLFISFIGTLLGYFFIPPSLSFMCAVIALLVLVMALILQWTKDKNIIKMPLVHAITFLMGVATSVSLKFYISSMGATWVILGLGITTLIFVGLSLYAHFSKRDFSFLGGIMFISLIALVVLGFANIFIGSSLMSVGLAFVGVVVFSGYVLYDVSNIKRISKDEIPLAVLGLYLDFINLFLNILRILAWLNSDD